ncbi:hypothetical protein AB0J90_05955 [Micromonospora sp. NPDC049523]|uniref:hypothetical protein n=1 Tax=Micromonospora sp. NPDC049523 TaxID=3155921 RepID=UPI003419F87D
MATTVRAQLRTLTRLRAALWAPGAVAVLALLLMPVYENGYEFVVNYDPQGDAEQFERLYTTALLRYTSGFVCGQLIALAVGAALGRHCVRTAAPARPLSIMATAGLAGTALGLLNLAVVAPAAALRTELAMSIVDVRAAGLDFDPDLLRDPGFWQVLLVGLLSFPLWAVAGAAAGLLLDPARVVPALLAWVLAGGVTAVLVVLWDERLAAVAALVSPPFGSVASPLGTGTNADAVTVALLVAGVAYAAVLGTAAVRVSPGRRRGVAG